MAGQNPEAQTLRPCSLASLLVCSLVGMLLLGEAKFCDSRHLRDVPTPAVGGLGGWPSGVVEIRVLGGLGSIGIRTYPRHYTI